MEKNTDMIIHNGKHYHFEWYEKEGIQYISLTQVNDPEQFEDGQDSPETYDLSED